MRKVKMGKKMFVFISVLTFIISLALGIVSKFAIKPAWTKDYSVTWSDDIGTRYTDLAYGEGEANKFDLYLPKDSSKEHYGLVIYLHAGGFTTGDKSDDEAMLSWLTSKGYVAAGINYTLRNETNTASVLSQSNEIKEAIPKVIDAAKEYGYNIDEMAVAGGSAGHALAMLYSYRDGANSPVPIKLTFGAVGPSSFYVEDWGIFGLGQDTEESREAGANLLSVMSGEEITAEMIADGSYLEKVKPIAASEWITENSPATVVAYGTHDKMQPFQASQRLLQTLEENKIDYKYFEMPHSGHGLQNDSKLYQEYMETVEEYLNLYMPVNN
ncbi:TPA: alpha/beta hydrolase [Streptococcus suis]|nr:alpha/beta hydrolase [Streptococcus suis]HEM3622882.1 alpha/beta hydrolase [Streptococcus suis]HEM3627088.1 alpha/beta hydrolase [Streptococcus suis]HEM3631736.1 alpha/beta hydrolase [Streptococcus suis]HEM3640048.1 alpha/beta hydrolase [Streptococcus suis]